MDSRDRRLGMDRAISRRDFLHGVGIAIGASLVPACAKNGDPIASEQAPYYPPAEMGMRGSHPGSFEAAHAVVQGQHWPAGPASEHYDLVVVGAGISGLAAAYLYRRDVNPDARILVLDNHDDFGGHAKRNEFTIDGQTLLGFGGTMFMEATKSYPAVAKQVVRELGIDTGRADKYRDKDLFASLGMGYASFFDKETFGADYLAGGGRGYTDAFADAPLSAMAKEELARLFADKEDYLAGMSPTERRAVIEAHSWRDYLASFAGIGEEALTYMQKWGQGLWAIGADAFPAWLAWLEGFPGFAGMDIGYGDEDADWEGGEDVYFPDGNATVARLLVRKLVPGSAPGDSMEDIVTARFDYSTLDLEENATRIRLNSTVVDLRHQDGKLDADVDVTYARDNEARTVTARKVVWAGYHAMLPHVCPEVPNEQAAAQRSAVRAPLAYTSVLVRSWRSFINLGVWRVYCPGSFFSSVRINRPVSIGDYRFPESPDEPVVLHLQHIPLAPGLTASEQFREGRRALLETSFETFERNVREQLGRMLGPGGFDPARDIAGITVNRWPHGYAYSADAESGEVAWWPEYWRHERRPWIDARQPIGNIAIAGTDASSNAMTESAIEEAHRAVQSLVAAGTY
jgi:spermidine dehydrogenase